MTSRLTSLKQWRNISQLFFSHWPQLFGFTCLHSVFVHEMKSYDVLSKCTKEREEQMHFGWEREKSENHETLETKFVCLGVASNRPSCLSISFVFRLSCSQDMSGVMCRRSEKETWTTDAEENREHEDFFDFFCFIDKMQVWGDAWKPYFGHNSSAQAMQFASIQCAWHVLEVPLWIGAPVGEGRPSKDTHGIVQVWLDVRLPW